MPTIDDIARQLKTLEDQYVLLPGQGNEIVGHLKELEKNDPKKFKEYSDSISEGLPGVTKGVIAAIKAGKNGDPLAISMAALDIFSSVVTMAGPLLGPAGPLVSALGGMISMILGEFLPKGPNLKQELTEVFDKFLAEELLRRLSSAADQIWVFADTLEHHNSAWTPLNILEGPQVQVIDDTWQWLLQADKQSLPQWGECLNKTCQVFNQLLRAVALSVAHPSTNKNVEPGVMLVYLPARLEQALSRLQQILPVAQKRGTFWHVGPNNLYSYLAIGKVYTTESVVKDIDWRNQQGASRVLSVTLNEGQNYRLTPTMTVVTLEPADGGSLPHAAEFGPDATKVFDDKTRPFRPSARAYWASGEWPVGSGWNQLHSDNPSFPLDGCYDIHAISADKRNPGGVYFYTANGKDYRGYELSRDGKVHSVWSAPVDGNRTVGTIRCVREPRICFDERGANKKDPSAATEAYSVVYGGCQHPSGTPIIMEILVQYWGIEGDNAVRYMGGPWSHFRGIAVDQTYLWVYTADLLACATHTSIREAVLAKRRPSWMSCTYVPPGLTFNNHPNFLSGLLDLTACDDGTLFAAYISGCWMTQGVNDTRLFQLTPQIDRQKQTLQIAASDSFQIRGRGIRVSKQPLFCWNMLEKLVATLEEKVKDGHSIAKALASRSATA